MPCKKLVFQQFGVFYSEMAVGKPVQALARQCPRAPLAWVGCPPPRLGRALQGVGELGAQWHSQLLLLALDKHRDGVVFLLLKPLSA